MNKQLTREEMQKYLYDIHLRYKEWEKAIRAVELLKEQTDNLIQILDHTPFSWELEDLESAVDAFEDIFNAEEYYRLYLQEKEDKNENDNQR